MRFGWWRLVKVPGVDTPGSVPYDCKSGPMTNAFAGVDGSGSSHQFGPRIESMTLGKFRVGIALPGRSGGASEQVRPVRKRLTDLTVCHKIGRFAGG